MAGVDEPGREAAADTVDHGSAPLGAVAVLEGEEVDVEDRICHGRMRMAAGTPDEREVMTWERFGEATRELAAAVHADGFAPDVVVAIARGGLTVAGALAYALDVKNCGAMNVEFYVGVDERLDVPVVIPPTLDLVDVAGLRVLIADDVADTGYTLKLVREVLAQHVAEARTAVLYRKPALGGRPELLLAGDRPVDRLPVVGQPPVTAPGVEKPVDGDRSAAQRRRRGRCRRSRRSPRTPGTPRWRRRPPDVDGQGDAAVGELRRPLGVDRALVEAGERLELGAGAGEDEVDDAATRAPTRSTWRTGAS